MFHFVSEQNEAQRDEEIFLVSDGGGRGIQAVSRAYTLNHTVLSDRWPKSMSIRRTIKEMIPRSPVC